VKRFRTTVATGLVTLVCLGAAEAIHADEAPISGTVKAVDAAAKTLTLDVTSKGKTRTVTVHMKPGARIVKFARATEPGKAGFVEQDVALGDLKPGWIVSATTKHEGDREVADAVKVVVER
jgi:hypothetical protein